MDFYERNKISRPIPNAASPSQLLDSRSRESILRNAFHNTQGMRKWRGSELWSWIGSMTGHGSGYSWQICIELGWDPEMRITPGANLPRRPAQQHGGDQS